VSLHDIDKDLKGAFLFSAGAFAGCNSETF